MSRGKHRATGEGERTPLSRALLFGAVVTLAYALLAEVLARVLLAALAGNMLPLAYGIDPHVRFMEQTTVRDPVFIYECRDCVEPAEATPVSERPSRRREKAEVLAYALGGSSTFGRNCSPDASSWPEELMARRPELHLVNKAKNAASSDYAIAVLESTLADSAPPDVVFWANWINELDIVFEGPERNRVRLEPRFGHLFVDRERAYARNRVQYALAALDRTFYKYSALYLLVSRLVTQMQIVAYVHTEAWRGLTAAEAEMAIANTLLNLSDAFALSRRFGFRLVLVRPPVSWPHFAEKYDPGTVAFLRTWNDGLGAALHSFAAEQGLTVLDVQDWFVRRGVSSDQYCDPVHMWRSGHELIAEAMDEMLGPDLGARAARVTAGETDLR